MAKETKEAKKKKPKDQPEAAAREDVPAPPPRLRERYRTEVRARLKEQFKIENDLAVPRLTKIVVNMGVKGAVENKARVDAATQRPATWRPSRARSRRSGRPGSRSRASSCARACRSPAP
jgi:hypothetical protein